MQLGYVAKIGDHGTKLIIGMVMMMQSIKPVMIAGLIVGGTMLDVRIARCRPATIRQDFLTLSQMGSRHNIRLRGREDGADRQTGQGRDDQKAH